MAGKFREQELLEELNKTVQGGDPVILDTFLTTTVLPHVRQKLSGQEADRILNKEPERIEIASSALNKMLMEKVNALKVTPELFKAKPQELTEKESADALLTVLSKPAEFGLTEEDTNSLVSSAGMIFAIPEAATKEVDKKEATAKYLQGISSFQGDSKEGISSKTIGELRALEEDIIKFSRSSQLDTEARRKALDSINAQTSAIKAAYDLNPGNFISQSGLIQNIGGQAIKRGTKRLTQKAATGITSKALVGAGTKAATAASAVGTALIAKDFAFAVSKYIKKNKDNLLLLGGGILALPAMIVAGLVYFLGALTQGVTISVATIIPSLAIGVPLILFIINSGAYIVPPQGGVASGGAPQQGGAECPAQSAPRPVATDVRFSSDGKYAFPLAPYGRTYYTCGHWDGGRASDMGINGITEKGFTGRGTIPVIAYTSGTIKSISLNDSKGGKYMILAGDDSRFYYYAHNCALYVEVGQRVNVGDVLATTDNTGSAAQSVEHLHFAISNQPSFFYGGTVCPSTDFEAKFGLGRCSSAQQCPAL